MSDWQSLFERQKSMYPQALLQDMLKALHQSLLGCGHLVEDEKGNFERLLSEWETAEGPGPLSEPLTGGFSRLHLRAAREEGLDPGVVQRLFLLSSRIRTGREDAYKEALRDIENAVKNGALPVTGHDRAVLEDTIARAPAPLSHSEAFRRAYRPAYRVISDDCAALLPLLARISRALAGAPRVVLALDGGCASGKSTVAALLPAVCGAAVVHMDDFYLRPEQRTPERYAAPGGNVDYERFLQEVGPALRTGGSIVYRRFDCRTMALGETVHLHEAPLTVVEGSYAMHPHLSGLYGLSCLVFADRETRSRRLLERNGTEGAQAFFTRWAPLEDFYMEKTGLPGRCDFALCWPDTPFAVQTENTDA